MTPILMYAWFLDFGELEKIVMNPVALTLALAGGCVWMTSIWKRQVKMSEEQTKQTVMLLDIKEALIHTTTRADEAWVLASGHEAVLRAEKGH